MSGEYNCLAVELYKEQLNLKYNVIVITLYRPPHTQIENFNLKLEYLLKGISK